MADKSFGVDQLDILGTGTPTISAPNQLNLDCNTVAISTSATVGQNLTVSANAGISSLNVTGIATVVNFNATGISTIAVPSNTNANSALLVTANGSSAYRFTGPGQDGSDDNPNIYLVRGQRYIFTNNSGGSHPFQIRVANGGAAYSTGVTNNGASSGNIIFNVQHDAPAQLYYQCTNHGGMVGNIYVVGGPQVISGVLTATSFSGSGANLTSLPSQVTINNASANRVLTSDGGTTLNGEANLTFNSSLVVTDGNGTVTTGGNYINLKRTSGNTNYINAPQSNAELVISADENIQFKTVHTGDFNSTERLRIHANGRIEPKYSSSAGATGGIIMVGGFQARPSAHHAEGVVQAKTNTNAHCFDAAGWYDNTNYRYVPQVKGHYIFYLTGMMYTGMNGNSVEQSLHVRLNGSGLHTYATGYNSNFGNYDLNTVTVVIYCNGTTDYVDWTLSSNRSPQIHSASVWSGFLLYPAA